MAKYNNEVKIISAIKRPMSERKLMYLIIGIQISILLVILFKK